MEENIQTHSRQRCQPLLKAKYSPQAMSLQHFMNPGQLVQAVSCTHKTHRIHVTLTFDYDLDI